MIDLINNIVKYIPDIAQIFMAISIIATVVVRMTPSKKDDEDTSKVVGNLLKALQYLPTIGVNPRTKKLEEAYQELKGK